MQDKYLCQKCGTQFRHEIRMYDPNTLYLDTQSPALPIKTEKGASVGCFYCFPVRRVAKGFIHLSDEESQKAEAEVIKQNAPSESKVTRFQEQFTQLKTDKSVASK